MMASPSPQLINQGPSSISRGVLELSCPRTLEGQQLLYVTRVEGLSNCTSSHPPNPESLEVRGPETGLGRGGTEAGEGRWGPGRATASSGLWEGKALGCMARSTLPFPPGQAYAGAHLCRPVSLDPKAGSNVCLLTGNI